MKEMKEQKGHVDFDKGRRIGATNEGFEVKRTTNDNILLGEPILILYCA
jgi:hypothetical protein